MEEKWKLIQGSNVEISNFGNARSYKTKKPRKVYSGANNEPRITYNNTNATLDILVAEMFLGMKKTQRVVHIDGDRKNCRVDNLKVVDKQKKRHKEHVYKITSYGQEARFYERLADCARAELKCKERLTFAAVKKRLGDHDIFIQRIPREECPELFSKNRKEVRQKQNYTIHEFLDYVVQKYGIEWYMGWDIPEMCKKDKYVREYYRFVKSLA